MTLGNEEEVKRALGIKSFRELSKEKVLTLAASMPNMANEVRLKLIEQIPAVQRFALDAVNAVERIFTKTVDTDDKDNERLHESMTDIRRVILGELSRDDISEEHRRFLMDKLTETGDSESRKNSENKKHRSEQAAESRKSVLIVVGIAVLTAILFAGGNVIATQAQADSDE